MEPIGRLHLLTDARRDPVPTVRAALSVGVPVVQVRVGDEVSDREAYTLTRTVLALCRAAGATCLVNDRVDIALATGADGVHLGADDLPVEVARRILGPGAVVGATARDPDTARAAVSAGAAYLGVGPAYATRTKDGLPDPIGVSGIGAVASTVDSPVVAIGGVTVARVPELLSAGAYGVAVVAAVNDAPDPAGACLAFLAALGLR
jgi:thiamine-phosphate pyrophosphorylase